MCSRRPSQGRGGRDVDATGSPRLLPQCEAIENLQIAQSDRPHRMPKKFRRRFCARLNSPKERVWNGRLWREAAVWEAPLRLFEMRRIFNDALFAKPLE